MTFGLAESGNTTLIDDSQNVPHFPKGFVKKKRDSGKVRNLSKLEKKKKKRKAKSKKKN